MLMNNDRFLIYVREFNEKMLFKVFILNYHNY